MPFHVQILVTRRSDPHYGFNLDEETLLERFIGPYERGEAITWGGRWSEPDAIRSIQIYETAEEIEASTTASTLVRVQVAMRQTTLSTDHLGTPDRIFPVGRRPRLSLEWTAIQVA
jgi:hypothetical protein